MNETRMLWRELLNIPEGYETVFFGGGASLGFLLAAMSKGYVFKESDLELKPDTPAPEVISSVKELFD